MCGIAGIAGECAVRHLDALRRMADAQSHRGPDGEGFYSSPQGLCVLGHRRLSILDLTEAAAQPMIAESGRHVLCYNGECYNFQILREELAKKGETLHSTGDTEVLLKLLAMEGPECLPRLNGMFAFGFWDDNDRTLLLGRDRFGQKPLYYAFAKSGAGGEGRLLLFASEIRALLASGMIERKLNPRSVHGFLRYGAVPGPETIVEGVWLIPAASWLLWRPGGEARVRSYWNAPTGEPREALPGSELRELFVEAVRRHLVSDAPIGLFLSGGIDSSAVAAAAAHLRQGSDPVITLSVVFPDQPSQSESAHARRMAALAGTDHREIPITGKQMLALLPGTLDAMDQPSIDGVNTSIVSFAARQAGLKVALSGLGGDELFGGYPSFRDVPRMLRIHSALGPLRRPAAGVLRAGAGEKRRESKNNLDRRNNGRNERTEINGGSLFSVRRSKLIDLFESSGDLLSAYLVRRQLFSSNQIAALAPAMDPIGCENSLPPEMTRTLQSMIEGASGQEAVSLLEISAYMGQTLLRDSDVMGMAHSLEIRTPFLDNAFTDRVLRARPADRFAGYFGGGLPKQKFIEAMGDWLPLENVNRRKQGFTLPFSEWMRGELRDHAAEGFAAFERFSGLINASMARRLWTEFCQRPASVGWARPWSLFVLGRYLDRQKLTL